MLPFMVTQRNEKPWDPVRHTVSLLLPKNNKRLKSNCKRVLSKSKQSKRASTLTKKENMESTEKDASSSFNAPTSQLVVLRQLRSCEKNP